MLKRARTHTHMHTHTSICKHICICTQINVRGTVDMKVDEACTHTQTHGEMLTETYRHTQTWLTYTRYAHRHDLRTHAVHTDMVYIHALCTHAWFTYARCARIHGVHTRTVHAYMVYIHALCLMRRQRTKKGTDARRHGLHTHAALHRQRTKKDTLCTHRRDPVDRHHVL
jgi:hypothetical protein